MSCWRATGDEDGTIVFASHSQQQTNTKQDDEKTERRKKRIMRNNLHCPSSSAVARPNNSLNEAYISVLKSWLYSNPRAGVAPFQISAPFQPPTPGPNASIVS